MKPSRALSALLCTACFITANLPITPLSQALAAPAGASAQSLERGKRILLDAVRDSVAQDAALADGVGDKAMLVGTWRGIRLHPEFADTIIAAAKDIRPELSHQIDQTAQLAFNEMKTLQASRTAPTAQSSPQAVAQAPKPAVPSAPPAAERKTGGPGTSAFLGLAGVAAVAAGIAAAYGEDDEGGSGGGGSGVPEDYETPEYEAQYGLAAINASTAYARGGNGEGIIVAVADTGLLTTHEDIDDNVSPDGYDVVTDSAVVTDPDGHGTHVAGTIGAERNGVEEEGEESEENIMGVAYNATILPITIFAEAEEGEEPFTTSAAVVAATNYAVENNARVYNGSYGPSYSDDSAVTQAISAGDQSVADAYQDAADAGVVLVISAGNNFVVAPTVAVNPTGGGLYPYVRPENADSGVYDDSGADYDFSGLEGMLLTVVATDEDGLIADFSNRCGVASAWCLAAPGVNILSLGIDGGYTELSGTSMAAPHVSGAVAILMQMFPELTPEEIVERVLVSANKTGDYADETVYGQGFLDLEQATLPIGALSVSTGMSVYDGQSVALESSNMNLGPAFGDGLRAALVGQKLAVFDRQKATFLVDLGDFTRTADSRFDLNGALQRFRSRFGAQEITMENGSSLSYTMVDIGNHSSVRQDPASGNRNNIMEVAYRQNLGGMQWKMNYNVHPATMFGIYQSENVNSSAMLSQDAFSAPYLSFAKQGYSMGSQVALSDTFSLSFGAFQGYPLSNEQMPDEERAESFGQLVELGYRKGPVRFFSQLGMLSEKETFLGSRSEGAFDLASGTHTSFAGFNSAYELSPQWNLVGSYYRGVSSPKLDGNSLFDDISEVHSESFSLGMMGHGIVREGDTLGLLGNQPLRVVGGDARMSLATGRGRSGVLYKQDYAVNLAPTGRELNLEAFYQFAVADVGTQLMSSLMWRTEPGHIENAPDEGVFLLQMQQPF
jgi:subtilisin family serine protease